MPILIKLYGLIFEAGFEELSRAYHTSINMHADRKADAEATVRRRYRMTPDEVIPEVEYDEHGEPSHDFWEDVSEVEREADSTAQIIRTAFLNGLCHFWEKHSNRWISRQAYDHKKVMAWLKRQGYSPDDEALKDLELAANCAKHGPGKSASQLLARRPDLFTIPEIINHPLAPFKASDESLNIDGKALQAFFDVVRQSGPG
jgi:hypothetical protein